VNESSLLKLFKKLANSLELLKARRVKKRATFFFGDVYSTL
jgi:hypothetical protein